MSHIVTIKTLVRDPSAIAAVCERMRLPPAMHGTTELFSGHATGTIVRLPEWKYPVVFDLATGEARYDAYEGKWGDLQHLSQFMQYYAVERAKIEARKKGYFTTEQQLRDGSIRVQIVTA